MGRYVRKKCKHANCDIFAQYKGCCRKHNPRRCKHSGCKNPPNIKGYCKTHHPIRCKHSGCKNAPKAKGYCTTHNPIRCKHPKCDNTPQTKGYCLTHNICSCENKKPVYKCWNCCSEKDRVRLCESDICGHQLLSRARKRAGIKLCKFCDDGLNKNWRIELKYLEMFKTWGFPPSSHDQVILDDNCNTITTHDEDNPDKVKPNRKRADYFWLTTVDLPYNVLAECDEGAHGGQLASCEYKKLQDKFDQIISNTHELKPMIVIRFNPDNKRIDVPVHVKSALEKAFRGEYKTPTDARGFEVVEFIGFSEKRMREINTSGLRKRQKI